jgi:hypothetical protein
MGHARSQALEYPIGVEEQEALARAPDAQLVQWQRIVGLDPGQVLGTRAAQESAEDRRPVLGNTLRRGKLRTLVFHLVPELPHPATMIHLGSQGVKVRFGPSHGDKNASARPRALRR